MRLFGPNSHQYAEPSQVMTEWLACSGAFPGDLPPPLMPVKQSDHLGTDKRLLHTPPIDSPPPPVTGRGGQFQERTKADSARSRPGRTGAVAWATD